MKAKTASHAFKKTWSILKKVLVEHKLKDTGQYWYAPKIYDQQAPRQGLLLAMGGDWKLYNPNMTMSKAFKIEAMQNPTRFEG